MRHLKRQKFVILMAVFLDFIAIGLLVPVVPQLLANPSSPYYLLPTSVPESYAYILLGFLIAAFPLFLFFSSPILGSYSDYYGRRNVMVYALTVFGLSLGIFALGIIYKNLTLLFVSRIIGGLSGGNATVAQAAIADITPPRERAKHFGLFGAAYGVGFILGPVLGGILSDQHLVSWFNAATPFWCGMILSLINAVLVWMYLGETRQHDRELQVTWKEPLRNIVRAYTIKKLRAIFATNFLFQSGLTLFATFFSVFLISQFGYDQVSVGYYIGYAGLWLIFSQVLVLPFVTRHFNEVSLVRFFLFTGALSIAAYYIPSHTVGLLIVGACFAVTNGVTMAALPSLLSQRATARIQGEVLGVNGSVQALAQVAPPIIAGFLAAKITPSAPVYVAAAVIGAAWVVFLIFVKKE